MTTRAYLLAENVDPRLRRPITSHAPELEVWCLGDAGAPPLHTDDPTIVAWCEANGFILVTNNRASMPAYLRNHLNGSRHVPGIFVLRKRASLGELADDLALICEASQAEEYEDRMVYLPLDR